MYALKLSKQGISSCALHIIILFLSVLIELIVVIDFLQLIPIFSWRLIALGDLMIL